MKALKYIFFLLPIIGFSQSPDGTFKTVTASGTNSYIISEVLSYPDAYSIKEKWIVTFTNGNTGSVTINRNSLGAKALKKLDGTDFASGDIPNGGRLLVSYNGTNFQAIGSGSGGGNPFADNTDLFKNSTDATKLLRFNLSGITTGTTRTITWPDANITIARNDAAQTFTGVQTFGSVPVFSAGLGTPTSLTLTNATGLPPTTGLSVGSGSALQQMRINAGATAWELFTPTVDPTTTVGDIIQRDGSGLSRLASVATGNVLLSGGVATLNNWGKIDLVAHVNSTRLAYSSLAQGSALSVLGVTGSSTADNASMTGTANQVMRVNSAGTAVGFGQVNLASSSAVTGVLPAANGGGYTTNTATLDFPSVSAGSTQTLTMTLTTAALNDAVVLGVPNGSMTTGLIFFGWVSASNTISIQCYNSTASPIDPASGTFRASTFK